MNIIARPYGSRLCYCRPDTTWERENKDFYVPEGIKELHWAPVIFVKISKAGKCIGKKFVSRYYDELNFGVLLYCMHESGQIAYSSCADHTSILPSPLYSTDILEETDTLFEVRKNEKVIFSLDPANLTSEIEDTICQASGLTSLRIGDYVAVELAEISQLVSYEEGLIELKASFGSNKLFKLKMIF